MGVRQGVPPRFSASAGAAMRYAATEAARMSPCEVSRVHLLLGLVHASDSIAGTVVADFALSAGPLWGTIERATGGVVARMPRTRAAWWALRPRWTGGARHALADAADAAE